MLVELDKYNLFVFKRLIFVCSVHVCKHVAERDKIKVW